MRISENEAATVAAAAAATEKGQREMQQGVPTSFNGVSEKLGEALTAKGKSCERTRRRKGRFYNNEWGEEGGEER